MGFSCPCQGLSRGSSWPCQGSSEGFSWPWHCFSHHARALPCVLVAMPRLIPGVLVVTPGLIPKVLVAMPTMRRLFPLGYRGQGLSLGFSWPCQGSSQGFSWPCQGSPQGFSWPCQGLSHGVLVTMPRLIPGVLVAIPRGSRVPWGSRARSYHTIVFYMFVDLGVIRGPSRECPRASRGQPPKIWKINDPIGIGVAMSMGAL